LKEADIVFDVGGGKYDHHGEAELYPNGIKMAAVGKIFRDFSPYILKCYDVEPNDDIYSEVIELITRDVLYGVEAQDNGQESDYAHLFTWVNAMNPIDLADTDIQFNVSVSIATTILDNVIRKIVYKVKSSAEVFEALASPDAHVAERSVYIGEYKPWSETAISYNRDMPDAYKVVCVLWKSGEEDYKVQCVPLGPKSFDTYVLAPTGWRGLRNEEFAKASGLESAVFCHPTGFICGFKTYDDAVAAARIIEACICE
jgi:uncharacterized UPF0160 family protein